MTDLPSLLKALAGAGVEFIVVGGAAATAHGSSRLTADLDVVYRRNRENIGKLAAALAPFNPYLRGAPSGLPFRWDEKTIARGLNFTLATTLGDLDLLGEIAGGGDFEDLVAHSITLHVFGIDCYCLSLRQLIQAKRASARPKDLDTIAELEAILEEQQGNAES